MIRKFRVSNDPAFYEAWPDVVMLPDGDLIAVFCECTHHNDRSFSRIVYTLSHDRGRTWSGKRPLTEATYGLACYYNCPRISLLRDGRVAVIVDQVNGGSEALPGTTRVKIYFSSDSGKSWSAPMPTPLDGIVPEKLTELDSGRWLISAHRREQGRLAQFLHYSDDRGKSWSEAVPVASVPGLNLCEASLIPLGGGKVAALLRENSNLGLDCRKCVSADDGETWGEVTDFPLPGCHRPTGGVLRDGRILVTYRFMHGGAGKIGERCQNFMAALCDASAMESRCRSDASVRIMPVDFDRSPNADLGYSGWVQFPDGEIYAVSYIVDDAFDKAQIRGYSFTTEDFILEKKR